MADRYLIQGATYYGDGTTSAEATSNGGVGAWNNINILAGTAPTYGTLASGDVVYIRSKTGAGANADITVTFNAADINLGSTAGTAAAPITWVLDNGTKWSSIDGTLTYSSTGAYRVWFRPNNLFIARTLLNWKVVNTYTSAFVTKFADIDGTCKGLLFDFSTGSTGTEPGYIATFGDMVQCRVKFRYATRQGMCYVGSATWQRPRFIDTDFEQTLSGGTYPGLFWIGSSNVNVEVLGGRYFGAGADANASLLSIGNANTSGTVLRTVGFRVPAAIGLYTDMNTARGVQVDMQGADEKYGTFVAREWGYASSRLDGFFPYKDAFLPDSAGTGWSWQLRPLAATPILPMVFTVASKLFVNTAAAITVTQRLNIGNATYDGSLNTNNTWVEVSYVDDTTGDLKTVSSRDEFGAGSSLASGPSWSSASYGAVALTSRQIAVTTPTTVKTNTLVLVRLYTTKASVGAPQMIFACPDPLIT